MRLNTFVILTLIFLLFSGCFSNSTQVKKRLVVKSKHIYSNLKGFIAPQYIIIEDSKIIALTNNYKPQAHDVLKDFSDYYVFPGLIDAHTHLFLTDNSLDADFPGELLKNLGMNELKRVEVAQRRAKAYLKGGFVALRDLGNSGRYLDRDLSLSISQRPS
jgi:imidazolonepropionase-like amidohydrolase